MSLDRIADTLDDILDYLDDFDDLNVNIDNEDYHEELRAIKKELFNLNDSLIVIMALKYVELTKNNTSDRSVLDEVEEAIHILYRINMPPVRK